MQKIPFVTYFDSFLREPRAATQIGSPHVTTGLVNHNRQFSLQIANVAVWGPAGGMSFLTSDTWRLDFEGMANVTGKLDVCVECRKINANHGKGVASCHEEAHKHREYPNEICVFSA